MDELHGMHSGGESGGVPGLLVDDGGAVLVESRDLDAIHFDFHAAAIGGASAAKGLGGRASQKNNEAAATQRVFHGSSIHPTGMTPFSTRDKMPFSTSTNTVP
jgi:hypothetical protein